MKGPGILLIGAAGPETADGLRSLEQAGCRVLLAESAAEAIDMIAKEGLDAILVDLVSPGMDALRIATELRASGNHTQLPMLAVTTGSGAALAGALEAGYDGYVAAPVNHASFWREVSHILVERRSSRGSLLAPDWRMSRGKVLVVEDEETNHHLLEFLLARDGHDVSAATNGEVGVEMAKEVVPDCVILDVLLPGDISGYDVCRALKADPNLADIPVLMVSILLDPRDRLEALKVGATDFLSRPLEAREITLRTRNYVFARHVRQELEDNLRSLRRQEQTRDGLTDMLIHDLRAPLVGISGFLDYALRGPEEDLSGAGRKLVERARVNTRLMDRLIRRLLEVSKLEAGAFPLEISHATLGDLIETAVSIIGSDAERIDVDVDASETVACDADLMIRLVTNLLSNAMAVSSPDARVDLSAHVVDGDVRIEVLDRGPGVADEHKDSIFDRFVQGPVAERAHSSGLGLTFCKLVMKAHGGSVTVQDRPGGGATFVVDLPGKGAED